MIKNVIARAMQISVMEKDQIERLHQIEIKNNFLLNNWNIQEFFKLIPLCEQYAIASDPLDQAKHNQRIEEEINRLNLKKTAEPYEEKLEWVHAFDWNIHYHRGNIMWDYSGGSKHGNLKEKLRD